MEWFRMEEAPLPNAWNSLSVVKWEVGSCGGDNGLVTMRCHGLGFLWKT